MELTHNKHCFHGSACNAWRTYDTYACWRCRLCFRKPWKSHSILSSNVKELTPNILDNLSPFPIIEKKKKKLSGIINIVITEFLKHCYCCPWRDYLGLNMVVALRNAKCTLKFLISWHYFLEDRITRGYRLFYFISWKALFGTHFVECLFLSLSGSSKKGDKISSV